MTERAVLKSDTTMRTIGLRPPALTDIAGIGRRGRFAVMAAYGGSDNNPAWYLNLKQNPVATALVDNANITVEIGRATPDERARLWPELVEMYP